MRVLGSGAPEANLVKAPRGPRGICEEAGLHADTVDFLLCKKIVFKHFICGQRLDGLIEKDEHALAGVAQ